jgi:SHO1 osmosensor
MLCLIIGVFTVIVSDTTENYHVAIVGFLASGLILTSSSVNSLLYSSNIAKQAAAAGFMLLSIVNVKITPLATICGVC